MTASGEVLSWPAHAPEHASPEAIDAAIYLVASNPNRLHTLVALAQAPEPQATARDMLRTIDSATGTHGDARHIRRDCLESLVPAGYALASDKVARRGSGNVVQEATGFTITPKGVAALAPAGAIVAWERRHSGLTFGELAGSVRIRRGSGEIFRGSAVRMGILEALVERPSGASLTELTQRTSDRTNFHAKQLGKLGVIHCVSKLNPGDRTLVISDAEVRQPLQGNRSEATRILGNAAALLRTNGRTNVSGSVLLDVVSTLLPPGSDPMLVWKALVAHQPKFLAFDDADRFGDNTSHTRYRIATPYMGMITDLLRTIRALKQDAIFWQESYNYGSHLLSGGVPAAVPLPRQGKRSMVSPSPPRKRAARLVTIPLENVPIRAPDLSGPEWVASAERRFSHAWREQAACAQVGSEVFFPTSATGLSAQHAEQAKKVCYSCPVRPACLKTAMGSDRSAGIWGGYSEKQRRRLPGEVKALLGEVSIG